MSESVYICPKCGIPNSLSPSAYCNAVAKGSTCKECKYKASSERYRAERWIDGKKKCSACGVPKDSGEFSQHKGKPDGLQPKCKQCVHDYLELYRKRNPEAFRAKWLNEYKKQKQQAPELILYRAAKNRAKKQCVPFSLKISDIVIPDVCPVLGIALYTGVGTAHANSPSVDKIIPELGYVKGNIAVISYRANTLKRDATVDELEKVLSYYKRSISAD